MRHVFLLIAANYFRWRHPEFLLPPALVAMLAACSKDDNPATPEPTVDKDPATFPERRLT